MILRVASDLHLDSYPAKQDRVDVLKRVYLDGDDYDFAILAGDLSNFQGWHCTWLEAYELLAETVTKPVVYVFGNHEYYGQRTKHDLHQAVAARGTFEYIFLLTPLDYSGRSKRGFLRAQGISFVGATNWYRPPSKALLRDTCFNDYQAIPSHKKTLPEHNQHDDLVLGDVCPEDIVVTHMMPSLELVHPKYYRQPDNHFYCRPRANFRTPKLWVFGHTHEHITDGNCIARPVGYRGEKSKPQWREHQVQL